MTRYGVSAQKINDLRTARSFIRLHTAFYFPLRGESRDVSAVPVKPVCILSLLQHTAMRAQSAPGFPCALSSERDMKPQSSGEKRAARMKAYVYTCHCERSEAI